MRWAVRRRVCAGEKLEDARTGGQSEGGAAEGELLARRKICGCGARRERTSPSSSRTPSARHEDRDVLFLLRARLPVKRHHLRPQCAPVPSLPRPHTHQTNRVPAQDARAFRFCKSKCHKNFKMKRNPRKLAWTKSFRHAHGKEMTVDSTLQFAARRNVPVRYNRELVQTTLKAMARVSEIRARRERAFYKARMRGNRERQRAEDRKLVEENQHLLPPSERWEAQTEESRVEEVREKVARRRQELEEEAMSEEEVPKMKTKRKLRMKVGGGVEQMDVDE